MPVLGRRTPLFLHEISCYKRPESATGLAAENGLWKTPGQSIALRRRIPGFQVAGTLQTLITQDLVQKSGSSLTGISPERLLRLKRALAASSPRYAMRSGCLAADRGALKPQKSGSRKAVFAQHRLSPAPAAAVLLRGTDGVYWLQVAFRDSGVGKELSVDTAYLREYIEFSRSLNFAQAAADLFVSPPTLRAHLHALEEEAGRLSRPSAPVSWSYRRLAVFS